MSISFYIIHIKQKNTENTLPFTFRMSVRSGIPHLISYIITQLHPFSLGKLELFVLSHVRLHGNKPSFEQQF